MPDLAYLLSKWWKKMLLFTLATTAVVTLILLLLPRQYLSEATALRASSYTTDKASIFNRNIEALYSTLGSADDLDMIIGTAQLDTVYLVQADSFALAAHYKIKGNPLTARRKAALKLKKNSEVMKSGYGELKVKVWDTDKQLAARLANGIMDKLQAIHQALLNESNLATLQGLATRKHKLQAVLDTMNAGSNSRYEALAGQLVQYEQLMGEYELMVDTRQPALLIVESARPGLRPARPRFLLSIAATLLFSLFFSLLLAVFYERKKETRP